MSGIRELVAEKKVEYVNMDNQIKWELIKFEIRKFTMAYSKKIAREKRKLLKLNENIARDFEIKPRNEHSISEEEYERAKQEIEKFHSEKTKGYILKTKC